jgi:transposase
LAYQPSGFRKQFGAALFWPASSNRQMQRFQISSLDQPLLLAPSLHDWVAENSLARFIAEILSEPNLYPIKDSYRRKDSRGPAGYHPELLVRLRLHGYATGITSSRRTKKATYDMGPVRYFASDQHHYHDIIVAFRRRHLVDLSKLFVKALQMCQRAGLVKPAVAIETPRTSTAARRKACWRW